MVDGRFCRSDTGIKCCKLCVVAVAPERKERVPVKIVPSSVHFCGNYRVRSIAGRIAMIAGRGEREERSIVFARRHRRADRPKSAAHRYPLRRRGMHRRGASLGDGADFTLVIALISRHRHSMFVFTEIHRRSISLDPSRRGIFVLPCFRPFVLLPRPRQRVYVSHHRASLSLSLSLSPRFLLVGPCCDVDAHDARTQTHSECSDTYVLTHAVRDA